MRPHRVAGRYSHHELSCACVLVAAVTNRFLLISSLLSGDVKRDQPVFIHQVSFYAARVLGSEPEANEYPDSRSGGSLPGTFWGSWNDVIISENRCDCVSRHG